MSERYAQNVNKIHFLKKYITFSVHRGNQANVLVCAQFTLGFNVNRY